jgi:peptidoglycan/LPS O-acetylase OafA/YrhL
MSIRKPRPKASISSVDVASDRSAERDLRLQSLRGLAALTVAIGHAFTVMVNGRIELPEFSLSPSNAFLAAGEILFQPNTAVIFFYVLSGMVLGESLRRRGTKSLAREMAGFCARRASRILPVMWLSILLATSVCIAVRHPPFEGATAWFNPNFAMKITLANVLKNLLALKTYINSVLWSVQIELAMIPVLPLTVRLVARTPLWGDAVLFAALALVSLALWGKAPNLVLYAYCFYLGLVLPKLLTQRFWAALLGSGAGLTIALMILLPVEYLFDTNGLWLPYKFVLNTLVSGEIIAFVLLRPETALCRMLHHPMLVWLGDVSYSFYAYAMTCLIGVGYLVLRLAPAAPGDAAATAMTIVMALGSIGLALGLAGPSYRLIEKPGMTRGQRWGRALETAGHPLLIFRRAAAGPQRRAFEIMTRPES